MIGYHVRLKLCKPKLQSWADVLMHIRITVGKSVNVKAVSWLVNMHTATPMSHYICPTYKKPGAHLAGWYQKVPPSCTTMKRGVLGFGR